MNKKLLLLALSAVSVLMFALPAAASAALEADPGAGVTFSGTTHTTTKSTLTATGEPTITCDGPDHVTGSFTSKTAGTINLDFTNCHITVLGIPVNCKSSGSAVENTIAVNNTPFDLAYVAVHKPAVLVTPPAGGVFVTIQCGSTTPILVKGNGVIGTITSPACGTASNTATLKFEATGANQTHKLIEGSATEWSLRAETQGSGNSVVASEVAAGEVTFSQAVTLTCN